MYRETVSISICFPGECISAHFCHLFFSQSCTLHRLLVCNRPRLVLMSGSKIGCVKGLVILIADIETEM